MRRNKLVYIITVVIILVLSYYINGYLDKQDVNENNTDVSYTPTKYFLPTSTTGQVIHHKYYSLSYNEKHEQAEWVAYELKKNHLSRNDHNRPYFEIDKAVKTKAAHWRNYKNSGYSKGHLCPAGDRRFSKFAYNETFLTSNITPQKQDFNSGIWNTIEQKVRYWAKKHDGVYVVTGGILTNNLSTIGKEEVSVPKYFYKIVLDNQEGEMKAIAFLIPHKETNASIYKFVTTIDHIETLTGIDFFPNLDDDKEMALEASADFKAWMF